MKRMCFVFLGVATLLTACNQNAGPPANPLAGDVNVNGWDSVRSADLNVPHGVHYATTNVGGATVAEISGVPENAASTERTGGVSVRMSPTVEAEASGGSIRIIVRAYATQEGSKLGLAYSTNEVGNSGWVQFPLTQTPSDYVFSYFVGRMQAGNGDYLGFRSYGNNAVRIVGFKVEATPAAVPASTPEPLRPTTSPAAAGSP